MFHHLWQTALASRQAHAYHACLYCGAVTVVGMCHPCRMTLKCAVVQTCAGRGGLACADSILGCVDCAVSQDLASSVFWLAQSLMLTAGGAVRVVLELAGIKNAFGKQLGSGNPLNNARATIEGLRAQRTVQQVAEERGLTVAELMGFKPGEPPAVPRQCPGDSLHDMHGILP